MRNDIRCPTVAQGPRPKPLKAGALSHGGGFFVVVEGGDGSGKSTQARILGESLKKRSLDVVLTQEPAGTPVGKLIKGIFERAHSEAGAPPISAKTELFLFEAARADHVRAVIRPALAEGKIVVCDRFGDSSLAYQGYGRGLPLPDIRRLNEIATEGLTPDLVVVFDIAPEAGLARADHGDKKKRDSIGQEPLEFHRRVREGFLDMARSGGERYVVVDVARPEDEVAAEVLRVVMAAIQANQS